MHNHHGSKNPNWKGGRKKTNAGYILVYCPDHPYCVDGKYVQEHRLVMEQAIGRYLLPTEVVHHKNGVRDDNRPENLELFASQREHGLHHAKDKKGKLPAWSAEGWQRILSGLAKRTIGDRPQFPCQCRRCGRDFLSYYRNRASYCSDACKDQARYMRRAQTL